MKTRYEYEDGVRIDWAFVDARDKQMRIRIAKRNLKDLRNRVPGTKIGPELSEWLWENTRNRVPDANDREQAKLLAKDGYDNSFIGAALELVPERVVEALAIRGAKCW